MQQAFKNKEGNVFDPTEDKDAFEKPPEPVTVNKQKSIGMGFFTAREDTFLNSGLEPGDPLAK